MKDNKGFTLIELIVTIALILLLFTIVVPSSIKLVQNSNKKHCKSVVDTLLSAADLYAIDNNVKTTTSINFSKLYEKGYLEDEYDFKNGYKIEEGILNTGSGNINIERITDTTYTENKRGYNIYTLTIDSKNNYAICE